MTPYPSYKPSGIDWLPEIPSHWEMSKAKYYFDYTTGFTPPSGQDEFYNGDLTWVTIADMDQKVISDSVNTISPLAIEKYKPDVTKEGALLFSFKLSVGKVAYAGKDLYTNEAIISILPNNSYDVRYFYYTLPEQLLQNANENIYGAKMLNQELIRNAPICFPPLEEQTTIANFLDEKTTKIDQLISNKQKLIELLKEERTAIVNRSVTKGITSNVKLKASDFDWLGAIPENWKTKKLKYISPKVMVGLVINPSTYFDEAGTIPMLTGRNVSPYHIKAESAKLITEISDKELYKTRLDEGDIVVVRVGYPGIAAVVSKEMAGANCASMMIVRKGEFDSDFLCYCFNSDLGKCQVEIVAYGAAQKQFNISHATEFTFPVPPIEEQTAIVRHIQTETQRIDNTISKIEKEIELMEEYRTALISEVVTGKVDVRGYKSKKRERKLAVENSG
jgi:type I restriction enzyme S subunit